eukprot:1291476-Amphidinium_carterae.1
MPLKPKYPIPGNAYKDLRRAPLGLKISRIWSTLLIQRQSTVSSTFLMQYRPGLFNDQHFLKTIRETSAKYPRNGTLKGLVEKLALHPSQMFESRPN